MASFATDLNFMQEVRENLGEFSPFLTLSYQRYIDCIHSQSSPYKANSHASASSASRTYLKPPPSTKQGKMPQNHYLKSGPSGTFSACKCAQFESAGLFFHLLWYAYLIRCPRLDLIWCSLVQGWWWATSEGLRMCCFLCFICWPTVLIYCASAWFYLHMKCWEHFNLLAMNNDSWKEV